MDPKWGQIGEFRCCPHVTVCKQISDPAARRMSTHAFFSCVPSPVPTVKVLYRSHVLTTFLDPILEAMTKHVCWYSRRSKAHRDACPRHEDKARLTGTRIYVLLGPAVAGDTVVPCRFAKVLLFVKAAPFWQKGHCRISFSEL